MAHKRLAKIAIDLNVGTDTIVEHLTKKGYTIENKPNSMVDDGMQAELAKVFQEHAKDRTDADNIHIGQQRNLPNRRETTDVPVIAPVTERKPSQFLKGIFSKKEAEVQASSVAKPEPVVVEPPVVQAQVAPVAQPAAVEPVIVTPTPPTEPIVRPVVEKVEPAAPEPIKAESVKSKSEPVKPEQAKPEQARPQQVRPDQPKQDQPKQDQQRPATNQSQQQRQELKKPNQSDANMAQSSRRPLPGLTVVDKVDLNAPRKVYAKPEPKPKPAVVPPPVAAPAPVEKVVSPDDNLIRGKTPELRGLKVMGKIDIAAKTDPNRSNDKNKRKRKTIATPRPGGGQGSGQGQGGGQGSQGSGQGSQGSGPGGNRQGQGGGAGGGNRPGGPGGNRPGGTGGGNRPSGPGGNRSGQPSYTPGQPREISSKEIDDKIRSTMAAMSGGRNNTRNRVKARRDKRELHRERAEKRDAQEMSGKLQLTEFVTASDLASLMDITPSQVIMTCMGLGIMVSLNQRLDAEIIELVAQDFGFEVEFISAESETDLVDDFIDDPAKLLARAPIVTVMGHVDHGKTSLLDHIRRAKVAAGEAGGITQHIGAYEVTTDDGRRVTFLDTPGHEAFTAMRARGAKVTDIAVIIIAADDNIMPQTKEAISHAQAAGVPMVFAINKIDKDGADPERIKTELASMNLLVEDWGGKYQSQDISAKIGTGIDALLEKILLEAELLELKANPERDAIGTVVEASLDKGRGYVSKILIQTGTLKEGDIIVSGEYSGRVKAMFNEHGKRIKSAGPSAPVAVLGLTGAPAAGEKFKVMQSEQEARQIASKRAQIAREQASRASKRISLDEIGRRLALGTFKELNLIVKGDVDGSVEALADSLLKESIETVQVRVIHKAVGQIIESDVMLASASDAIIIGFQVRPSSGARKLAEQEGVQIKGYSIIYEAIEEIRSAIQGMLEPVSEEKILGQVEVRRIFTVSKVGNIAGSYVTEGKITRSSFVRVIRDGIVIFPNREGQKGEVSSLKREKDDTKEVRAGYECGVMVKNFNDYQEGDTIEAYEIVEVKRGG
jgi:translation initiation factor IF-2